MPRPQRPSGGGSHHCPKAEGETEGNTGGLERRSRGKITQRLFFLPISCLYFHWPSLTRSQKAKEPGDPRGRSQPPGGQMAQRMSGVAGKAMLVTECIFHLLLCTELSNQQESQSSGDSGRFTGCSETLRERCVGLRKVA